VRTPSTLSAKQPESTEEDKAGQYRKKRVRKRREAHRSTLGWQTWLASQ
jgi:hypothetical protein